MAHAQVRRRRWFFAVKASRMWWAPGCVRAVASNCMPIITGKQPHPPLCSRCGSWAKERSRLTESY